MTDDASPATHERYREPPPEVVRLVDAPPTPWIFASPDTRWMLFVEHPALPALADVARPMLRLAGLRIDPAADAHHQTSFGTGMVLRDREGGLVRRIELPAGRRISALSWSHDARRFACSLVGAEGSELAVGDVDGARLVLLPVRLHAVFGPGFEWSPDARSLVCTRVPAGRGAPPPKPAHAPGPVVQETRGEISPLRTFADLLASPYDEELFLHHATAELCEVVLPDVEGDEHDASAVRGLGASGLILGWDTAPDDHHLLVTRAHRPFSYLHDVYGFPQSIEVWDRASATRVHTVAEIPAAENIPIEGVRTSPRGVTWSPHEGSTLVWVEALDGGDPRRAAVARDRWVELAAPFDAKPREFLRLEHRASALSWMQDPGVVIAREYDRDRRWTRAAIRSRRDPSAAPIVLDDRSVRDQYHDPGVLLARPDGRGRRLVRQEGSSVFRAAEGEGPRGARPFLDRQDLASGTTDRLWECAEGEYESLVSLVEGADGRVEALITRRESAEEPPNLWLCPLGSGERRRLTDFPDPCPELRAITKELVHYRRADGVELSGKLYLPANRAPGERLPLVIWAYPQDHVDGGTASQVRGSTHRFFRPSGSSPLFFATQGYAVLDDASMPVIGDPATMNDTFVEQIVAGARAAIEALAGRGIADPGRVGVGGHSYGAFMTANLLAHSDLFRAGIARSGAYNRTLTPFGFQAERRSLWEAKESYWKLSPFLHAETIRAPLLLIHGAEDDNPGTFPLQSERLFHAIKGTGGRARYVSLPHESHAYRARESVLHVLAEMIDWFDEHVKRAAQR